MAKLPVPHELVGRALRETGLRERYGISVIAIQRMDASGQETRVAPRADTVLRRGDVLVVMGEEGAVERLRGE
jgi:trk system potassium uptake protein TrkA